MSSRGASLRSAVAMGNVEAVLLDLSGGCPVDDRDELGYTALHYACRSDRLNMESICMILLDHGAKSNAKTDNNVSPLHLCCLVQRPPTLIIGQENEAAVERNRKQNALIQSKLRILEDFWHTTVRG